MPGQPFFNAALFVLVLSSLLFLFNLNVVLKQLGAMLPDETLRHETRLFTAAQPLAARRSFVSRHGLRRFCSCTPRACLLTLGASFLLAWIHLGFWALTFFALLPLAMTMALIWKTKEIILDSVFGTRH